MFDGNFRRGRDWVVKICVFFGQLIDFCFEFVGESGRFCDGVHDGRSVFCASNSENSAFLYEAGVVVGGYGNLVCDVFVVGGVGVVDASVREAVGDEDGFTVEPIEQFL